MALTVDDDIVESLWVRMKGKVNKVDVVVGVYYQPLSQDTTTDELFYKELRDISRSAALVLMGDFNFPDVNWEHHTADTNKSRKFLKHVEDNFLVQVTHLVDQGKPVDVVVLDFSKAFDSVSHNHEFTKGKSCLTNIITFYDEMTGLVDEGRAVDIVYLDFRKVFDTVSHKIIIEKLLMHGLDEQTVRWIENWLNGQAQRVA
ncbi:hypothetical protein GRJ2_003231100 [Grus japonensis]|uniref:Endonuclease/exonuclease/phosphatase domain-containing protein n=1 Tax=Grus japonensis TaxID=30415 RepID=A0ABC9YDW9_GRUJA